VFDSVWSQHDVRGALQFPREQIVFRWADNIPLSARRNIICSRLNLRPNQVEVSTRWPASPRTRMT